jgi:hypothetical protein
MFGSDVLDVGVGMSLLFLMMSLIATAVREAIEGYMKSRSTDLEKGLREMLDESGKTSFDVNTMIGKLYNHPLISSLYKGSVDPVKGGDLPSYIPSKAFVSAILDIVVNPAVVASAAAPEAGTAATPTDRKKLTMDELVRSSTANLPPRVASVLNTAIDNAAGDINAVRKNLEDWFDGTMDRVSGWYRRRTQSILFVIGIVSAVVLNVDSITIASRLTNDKTLRAAIVETARTQSTPGAQGAASAPSTTKTFDQIATELSGIGYPIGWRDLSPEPQMCKPNKGPCEYSGAALLKTVVGWLVTAFAIMLGAPFWFDVLNKFVVVRSTVKPSEKSSDEASKDSSAAPPSLNLVVSSAGDAAPAAGGTDNKS